MTCFTSGELASAEAAYATSDQIYILQHPSPANSTNAVAANILSNVASQKSNALGVVPVVQSHLTTSDPLSRLFATLEKGTIVSVLTTSRSLIPLIPHLYTLASSRAAAVLHVSAQSNPDHDPSPGTYGDFSDVFAVRSTGLALLSSSTVQESQDLSLIAYSSSLRSHTPILHFFDSRRVSHEVTNINPFTSMNLSQLVTQDAVDSYRARLASHIDSLPKGIEHLYLRHKYKSTEDPRSDARAAIAEAMDTFAAVTGRRYYPLEYRGHPQATEVIIAMGAGAEVVSRAVSILVSSDPTRLLGSLNLRLYRPWSDAALLASLPDTVRRVAVLEPARDDSSTWAPVFLDVSSAFAGVSNVEIFSDMYGLGDDDFEIGRVVEVADALRSDIVPSDGPKLVLPSSRRNRNDIDDSDDSDSMAVFDVLPRPGTLEAIVWTPAGDRGALTSTLSTALHSSEPSLSSRTQSYTFPASPTACSTHLRVIPGMASPLPTLIARSPVIAVSSASILSASDGTSLLSRLARNGTVLLNLPVTSDFSRILPPSFRRTLARRSARLLVYDAADVAREAGFIGDDVEAEVALAVALSRVILGSERQPAAIEAIRAARTGQESIVERALRHEPTVVGIPADWALLPSEFVPTSAPLSSIATPSPPAPAIESAYLNILTHVFGDRLFVANATQSETIWSPTSGSVESNSPEFGYGLLLAMEAERSRLRDDVLALLREGGAGIDPEVLDALGRWAAVESAGGSGSAEVTAKLAEILDRHHTASASLHGIWMRRHHLLRRSNWLLGSDTWSYDLGASGLHHVVADKSRNFNLLIVDTQPYSQTPAVGALGRADRKKDVGLYAMNHGHCYVASVALYSSYTGVLHALMEADRFDGPSIVLAYLPQLHNDGIPTTPLEIMKETKVNVDSGAWPLYRWNPALEREGRDPFCLDSERIKRDLEQFLERENHLSVLTAHEPRLGGGLSGLGSASIEEDVSKRHEDLKRQARETYARLLSGLSGAAATGPPVVILFGSDNGNAEGVAKHLAGRGKARGLRVNLMAADDLAGEGEGVVDSLREAENVVLVCCTAGQGEFPSNAREFWKGLNALVGADLLSGTKFCVFGLGDSHYWPREEDAAYYNRPGKLLDSKFAELGAERLIALGLGDDQDSDGFQTALTAWEPELWKALGVGDVEAAEEPPKRTDEINKIESNYLRGTISKELEDESTGSMNEWDVKLLKHHGSYMQDDRDLREERRKMGVEKAFSFMIRVRVPGGVATSDQWLQMDKLADDYAGSALKLTTRQAFQVHGVLKRNLRTTIRGINEALLSTLAACGDVNRNIMMTTVPQDSNVHEQIYGFVVDLMRHLAPRTTAYHEIWIEDKMVAGEAVQDFEPLYGPTYLPRKFKVVIAIPPSNDVDVYAHDVGLIAIVEDGVVVGYNVLAGGGMGMTHNNKKTYPRVGSMLGFSPTEKIIDVVEKIMTTQRDFGDRVNRKHARLKYTIDDRGVEWFKGEVESRCGWQFESARPFEFTDNADRYGWTKGADDKWHFGMFIENGKVKDWPEFPVKTGLRELAKWHTGDFRLTPNQHLIIGNVPERDLERTKQHLAKYRMDNLQYTALRKNAMACVALPTCGMAMAESERYLPELVTKIERIIEAAGLQDDAITIRMTGCPNGCARPYLGEIAFVGKAPGTYNVYLGAGHRGERLNKIYKESLKEDEILAELEPVIKGYAKERQDGEFFGDWVIRAGYVKETREGKDFHDL